MIIRKKKSILQEVTKKSWSIEPGKMKERDDCWGTNTNGTGGK